MDTDNDFYDSPLMMDNSSSDEVVFLLK